MAARSGEKRLGRPTKSGVFLSAILVLVFLSALNTGENLLYIVFGGLLSVMLVSGALGWMNLRGITVSREAPHAVFRGEQVLVRVTLSNTKTFLSSVSLRLGLEGADGRTFSYALKTPARGALLLDMRHVFDRRGAYTLPPCLLSSSYPFGFFERRRAFRDAEEVLVYPRVRAVRLSALEQLPGASVAPRRSMSDGDEYVSLREYVPGDDTRLIAWRVSARRGVWMVREMGFGNVRAVMLFLDTVPDGLPDFDGRFEDAVELAASIAVTLLQRQYSVGLSAGSHLVPMGTGTFQERKILDALARVEAGGGAESAARAEEEARRMKSEPARLVAVSADAGKWGRQAGPAGIPVLDPGGLAHV
ncbi:MAG TPA: DUF58 domain-containing protein [Candidatus Hydrogenedentes bacterium]|nr:DUF58 domain-containing protein [Candidatus Hydrogenedentota bacterium]